MVLMVPPRVPQECDQGPCRSRPDRQAEARALPRLEADVPPPGVPGRERQDGHDRQRQPVEQV